MVKIIKESYICVLLLRRFCGWNPETRYSNIFVVLSTPSKNMPRWHLMFGQSSDYFCLTIVPFDAAHSTLMAAP